MPKRPKTAQDYHRLAKKHGGEWNGRGVPEGTRTQTNWECAHGHTFSAPYDNIRRIKPSGCWCPHCRRASKKSRWLDKDDDRIMRNYGTLPLSRIAWYVNRSPEAVDARAKELGLPDLDVRDDVLTPRQFRAETGLDAAEARNLLAGHPHLAAVMYDGDTPVRVVYVDALARWLKRPCHWQLIDVRKLATPVLRDAVVSTYRTLQLRRKRATRLAPTP